MVIESSDFFSIAPESQTAWSRDTSWFHLERIQVGSRLLARKSLKPQYLGDTRLRETLRKPTNIMVTKVSHDVRIIDLGFCYADAYQSSMGMTDAFAAPEQQNGSGEVDTRTDIYAVGKILEWLAAELGKSCRWCRSRVYKRLVSRCLQKEKGKRWQNIDEMIAFLQQNHSHKHLRYAAAASVTLIVLLSLVSYAFSRPVLDEDRHVFYGNFSLRKFTYLFPHFQIFLPTDANWISLNSSCRSIFVQDTKIMLRCAR